MAIYFGLKWKPGGNIRYVVILDNAMWCTWSRFHKIIQNEKWLARRYHQTKGKKMNDEIIGNLK